MLNGLIAKATPRGSSAMKNGSVRNNTSFDVFLELFGVDDFIFSCFVLAFRISLINKAVTIGNKIQGIIWNWKNFLGKLKED